MEQDSYKIAIVGGGPAGCCCAYFIKKFRPDFEVSIIDDRNLLVTLLPTGNGRCNLANAEFNFKELAKNYPNGEKFLYSIFSRFSTQDTINLFEELGIKTYTQEDGRIFPTSNSAKDVRSRFLTALANINHIKEKALRIETGEKFKIVTDMNSYYFNKVVYASGSHCGLDVIKRIGVECIDFKPSLVGLTTTEDFSNLAGITLNDVYNYQTGETGQMLFTHFGISAPLIYKISALKSREEYPYVLTFDFYNRSFDLQDLLNKNPHKAIKNLISEFLPHRFAEYIINKSKISIDKKCHLINGKERDCILKNIHEHEIKINGVNKDGETVNSGGVDLNKINPKTMMYKDIKNLYFCGEVLNIDGFCGGFNLQNCWSTGFVASKGVCDTDN